MNKFKDSQIPSDLPSHKIQNPLFLITLVISAVIAQIFIINEMFMAGVLTYLFCLVGFLTWAQLSPSSMHVITNQFRLTQKATLIFLGIIIIITIATRFFDLNSRVYGLDADETKWTAQSWYSTILHLDTGEFASKHYQYVPVDFWVRSIFLRIFGLNFISARIESAVLSLIAVVSLYLLVELITSNTTIGLISSLVFSLSFIELNASHQALHGTPPLAWMLASFVVLFIAIRDRKWWQFQIAGLLLALGMLTYETFYPNFAVAFLYLVIIAIQEIKKKQDFLKSWAINLILVAWPTILVYFIFIRNYLSNGRQNYLFGLLVQASANEDFSGLAQFFRENFLHVLVTTFSKIIFGDSLVNWDGPLLNPLVLPFIVLGLAYNLWHIRQSHFSFIPLLYVSHVFSGSILLGVAWPRVMYLSIPALMIWAGFGLGIALAAIREVFKGRSRYVTALSFAFLLAAIVINDNIIFKTRLIDPEEHQKRRELADITIVHAKNPSLLFYSFIPNQKDFVELDSRIINFSIAGAKNMGINAKNHYRLISINQMMQSLWLNKDNGEIDLIFDKTSPTLMEERTKQLKTILTCYSQADLSYQGKFFDAYHFSKQTLQHPACYSPLTPVNIQPTGTIPEGKASALEFKWASHDIQSSGYIFTLEKILTDTLWVEVEESFTGEGWLSENLAVPGYSGQGYLADSGENLTGEAIYTINMETDGNYNIWVRTYKRRDNDQHNFVTVQGTKTEIAKTGQALNEWVWESIGTYNLPAGTTTITLTREYGVDELYSTFIDAMVITTSVSFQPTAEEKAWETVFSVNNPTSGANSFVLNEPLPIGSYRWNVRIFSMENIVDANGNSWIESDKSTFQVVE